MMAHLKFMEMEQGLAVTFPALYMRRSVSLPGSARATPRSQSPQRSPRSVRSRSPTELGGSLDVNRAQRELIAQLEAKNREILKEIQRLRQEQEQQARLTPADAARYHGNPTLLAELRLLRARRDELEARMAALQESRKELMLQLEGLMKRLKACSPRSTPTASPRARSHSGHSPHSPPPSNQHPPLLQRNNSLPPSLIGGGGHSDSLSGVGGDVRQAFLTASGGVSGASSVRSLRNDLLVAADSVTNAMSSLVKELNSEASSGSEGEDEGVVLPPAQRPLHASQQQQQHNNGHAPYYNANNGVGVRGNPHPWMDQLQRRLAAENQPRSRSSSQGACSETDHDVYMVTDDATDDAYSLVRTDDDDYENVAELRAYCHAANSQLSAILRHKMAAGQPPPSSPHHNHVTSAPTNRSAAAAGSSPRSSQAANHLSSGRSGAERYATSGGVGGVGGGGLGGGGDALTASAGSGVYLTETDGESCIRTDEEEAGGTEWEESMRRWVNR